MDRRSAVINPDDPEIRQIIQETIQECEKLFFTTGSGSDSEIDDTIRMLNEEIGQKKPYKDIVVFNSPKELSSTPWNGTQFGQVRSTFKKWNSFIHKFEKRFFYYCDPNGNPFLRTITQHILPKAPNYGVNDYTLGEYGFKRGRADFTRHANVLILSKICLLFKEQRNDFKDIEDIKKHLEKISKIIRTFWSIHLMQRYFGFEGFKENEVTIVRMPKFVKTRNGLIHHDGGPAIEFSDGHQEFYLDGVSVPAYFAITKDTEIDPKKILRIANAQIRSVVIRKIGVERMTHSLSDGPIDRLGEYELHRVSLSSSRRSTFLKMHNPSCPEIWHVEGIPNHISTIKDALLWRSGLRKNQIDDEKGSIWYQQGDVLIFSEDAKKFRSRPIILT